MGYHTTYKLEIVNATKEEKRKIIEHLDKLDNDSSYYLNEDGGSEESGCWGNVDESLTMLSRLYPDKEFILHGAEEEAGDLWRQYFANGTQKTVNASITYPTKVQNSTLFGICGINSFEALTKGELLLEEAIKNSVPQNFVYRSEWSAYEIAVDIIKRYAQLESERNEILSLGVTTSNKLIHIIKLLEGRNQKDEVFIDILKEAQLVFGDFIDKARQHG